MTNDYRIILPLMFALAVSLLLSQRIQKDSAYAMGLVRHGIRPDRGRDLEVMGAITEGDAMQEMALRRADVSDVAVEYGALVDGKRISEIPFPRGCVVASFRRRGQVFIPHGDTFLRWGCAGCGCGWLSARGCDQSMPAVPTLAHFEIREFVSVRLPLEGIQQK